MELAISNSFVSPEMEDFVVQLKESNMICFASDAIKQMSFESDEELDDAIKSAIEICINSGIPTEENFKRIYMCSSNGILNDWKLSAFAYKLVCLNGDSSNRKVAHFQVELLENNL